jgi:inosine-uridine nucleoside N-ribohydrolase
MVQDKLQSLLVLVIRFWVCPGVCLTVLALNLMVSMVEAKEIGTVPLIFDTDIGNDCDDVLALGMIHALESRGECKLLAVTITKDHELAAPFVDAVNWFYGRRNIPIGVCRGSGITPEAGKFNLLARQKDNGLERYPHRVKSGNDAPDAVSVLRQVLVASDDSSVVIVQVGFSTNLANLLDSKADEKSPLDGVELVRRKVKLLSIMAGAFQPIPDNRGEVHEHREYNVVQDIPSAQKLVKVWPTDIVWSGFEIGLALPYPHQSILRDYRYVKHHPLSEAYILYTPPPHDRPTWDLTSVLYAVRPDHNYFGLSERGRVEVAEDGLTKWHPDGRRDRTLVLREGDHARVLEALTLLSSQPPDCTVRGTDPAPSDPF